MNTKTIIIIGSVIIALLLAAFVYLLFFGTPKSVQDIWANLGERGQTDPGGIIPPVVEPTRPVITTRPRLRQLTQKPVAGFVETTYNNQLHVQFVEMGTGHIYRIDLNASPEERLSNTTIKEASLASFSSDGQRVAIRGSNTQRFAPITLGTLLGNGELSEVSELTEVIEEFQFSGTSTLLYTMRQPGVGLSARALDTVTGSSSALFTIPFFEARVIWGTSTRSTHYAYVKPTTMLEGYLYSFHNNRMRRTPIGGFGLTVVPPVGDYVLYSLVSNRTYEGTLRNLMAGYTAEVPIVALPEKCTSQSTGEPIVWCAFRAGNEWRDQMPDAWYKGQIGFRDELYKINLEEESTLWLIDTFEETNRDVDVWNLTLGASEKNLYFINKNDNTLWLYEL